MGSKKQKKRNQPSSKPLKNKAQTNDGEKTVDATTERKRLSAPQLTTCILLAIGIIYIVEFSRAADATNEYSLNACMLYYTTGAECTPVDAYFIGMKYRSGMLSAISVLVTALLSWDNPPLLQRLNLFLLGTPIFPTIAILFVSAEDAIVQNERMRIGLMALAMVLVVYTSNNVGVAPILKHKLKEISGVNSGLLMLVMVKMFEIYTAMSTGVEGYSTFGGSSDKDITDGSRVVFDFVIVDMAISMIISLFSFLYFDEVKRRSSLFVIGVISGIRLYFHLPLELEYIRDANAMQSLVQGITVLSIISSIV